MTLIRKARHYRCLGRCVPVCQKPLRQEYAALNKISVRCHSYFAREGPQELETGYARQCRQLGKGHLGSWGSLQVPDRSRHASAWASSGELRYVVPPQKMQEREQ